MEAVICPNCGDNHVQEIAEGKYKCLACDAEFLVHNLSKEFQKTDEHIIDVHRDLKHSIENLDLNGTGKDGLENMYRNASALLRQGSLERAEKCFSDICNYYAWSYKGYFGLVQIFLEREQYTELCFTGHFHKIKKCDDYSSDVETELQRLLEGKKEGLVKKIQEYIERCASNLEEFNRMLNFVKSQNDNKVQQLLGNKEKMKTDWESSSNVRKIAAALLVLVAFIFLIAMGSSLIGWVIGTKDLFAEAARESFLNRIWQYLIFSIWGLIKIMISILLICGTFGGAIALVSFVLDGFGDIERQQQKQMDELDQEISLTKSQEDYLETMLKDNQTCKENLEKVLLSTGKDVWSLDEISKWLVEAGDVLYYVRRVCNDSDKFRDGGYQIPERDKQNQIQENSESKSEKRCIMCRSQLPEGVNVCPVCGEKVKY